MVVVFTSHFENDEIFIPKGLLDEFIIPAAVSNQLLASQSKKKKLDSLSANFAEAPVQFDKRVYRRLLGVDKFSIFGQ